MNVDFLFQLAGVSGGGAISARSVIFDIADNWGNTSYLAVRSIEFLLGGVLIPNPNPTAYSTSELSASYAPANAFDTDLLKTGGTTNQWVSSASQTTNQRLIVDLGASTNFDEIVVNNGHNFGSYTTMGAKTVKITVTPDAYSNTVYNAAVTNGTVLQTTEWPEHVAADVIDDQTVWTG